MKDKIRTFDVSTAKYEGGTNNLPCKIDQMNQNRLRTQLSQKFNSWRSQTSPFTKKKLTAIFEITDEDDENYGCGEEK